MNETYCSKISMNEINLFADFVFVEIEKCELCTFEFYTQTADLKMSSLQKRENDV